MANNGKTSGELAQSMLDAFDLLAKAEVNSAQFDKTVVAIIVSCEDAAAGRYRVQYQDSIFNAYSSALDVTYTKGTSVQVRIPNNDFSGRKIIIGTCEENGIEYGIVVEDPLLRYEMIGSDCVMNGGKEEGMSTYWTEKKNNIILYNRSDGTNKIGLDTQMVWDNIKQGDSLILGATIKTDIDDEQRFSGNYGIKYTLTFENTVMINSDTPTINREYIVDIDKMSGDPYSYDNGTDQLIPFDVDSEHFLYVSKIELFAKHFPIEKEEEDADIWISNVRFQVANRLSEEEFNGTGLTIVTPEGNYFRETENLSTKRAIAELRIRGKITGNTRKVEYFWFIEDLRVNRSSNLGYHKYAGRGWRCLNEYNVTDGDVAKDLDGKEYYTEIRKVQYIAGKDTLQVKKDTTKARQTKYKCVAVYNETILEKEFIFTNYDIEDNLQIICDANPDFIDSIGKVTLTCLPNGQAEYAWARVDYEGGFEPLSETKDLNKQYHDNVKLRDDLQTALVNKTKPDNENTRAELQKYQSWIDSFNTKTRLENNQMINIQAASVFQQVVYKCQVFDKDGISLGIAAQRLTNTLKADGEEQSGNLIIKNGNQVYKYNAKGVSPCDEQWEEPQVILPLSFILRNAEGLEIPETAIKDRDVSWIVPTKNTMIKNVEGIFASTNEEEGYQVYNGKTLGYTINDNYYSQKDNNEIQLQVKYQGMLYIATTNLYFVKDGEDGTNGTEYVLKIIPQGTVGRLKTVGPNQSGTWFHAQLWRNGEKVFDTQVNQNSSNAKITWSMVGDNRATHNVTVSQTNATGVWTSVGYSQYSPTATDIVKATMEYNGLTIIATQPIIYAPTYASDKYQVSLKKSTGFTHVVYSEDGLTPDYDSTIPFELEVKKLINGQWGIITGHNTLNYKWSVVGNLAFKKGYTNEMSQVMFEPTGYFNSEEKGNAVICELWENTNYIGMFRIPIHFMLNRYGHSAINEWDGNSIQLTADGNTMLLAPQGGFGKKEKDNSYTGLLMGTVKDYTNDGLEHTGIFGYNWGTRTMFLDAENGSARFGAPKAAQIVIDPGKYEDPTDPMKGLTDNHARLYSGNFYRNYNSKTDLPTEYDKSNESWYDKVNNSEFNQYSKEEKEKHAQQKYGQGMMIDLTEPSIQWGNRNFVVNADGHITARGGGDIAGWKIDNFKIYKDKTGMSSVDKEGAEGVTEWNTYVPSAAGTESNKAMAFWAGRNKTSGKDQAKFYVAHDGYVRMQDATIGSGKESSLIYIGKSGEDSSIYTFGHPTLKTSADGFYLGTNGISLGKQFRITKDGTVTVGKGAVDDSSTKHWVMEANGGDETRIYYQKQNFSDNTEGVYIGTDGIALGGNTTPEGRSGFSVNKKGEFVARSGYIGNGSKGWKVEDTKIWNGKNAYDSGDAGVYIGTDGIGIGVNSDGNNSAFWVKRDGSFMARKGTIGGWEVTQNKIQSDNITLNAKGSIQCGDKWEIKQNGNATFNDLTANGTGHIAGWKINSDKLTGGNVTIAASGDLTGKNWYIKNDGSTNFGNLTIDANGNITANGGQFNNITAQGGTFNDITANRGTFNDITANNGTYNNITTNNMTANNITAASGTIGGCKIENGVLKVGNTNVTSVSASKISGGTLNITTGGGGYVKAGVDTTHLDASGVNVGSGGIAMGGNSISNCKDISITGGISANGGTLKINDKTKITGGLETDGLDVTGASTFGSVNFTNGLQVNGTSGKSGTMSGGVVIGVTDITLKFTHGILTSASGNWWS